MSSNLIKTFLWEIIYNMKDSLDVIVSMNNLTSFTENNIEHTSINTAPFSQS